MIPEILTYISKLSVTTSDMTHDCISFHYGVIRNVNAHFNFELQISAHDIIRTKEIKHTIQQRLEKKSSQDNEQHIHI